jgi:hypothetical protein
MIAVPIVLSINLTAKCFPQFFFGPLKKMAENNGCPAISGKKGLLLLADERKVLFLDRLRIAKSKLAFRT